MDGGDERLVHEKNYHITHIDCLLWLANNAINIPNEFISITEFFTFLEAISHPKKKKQHTYSIFAFSDRFINNTFAHHTIKVIFRINEQLFKIYLSLSFSFTISISLSFMIFI